MFTGVKEGRVKRLYPAEYYPSESIKEINQIKDGLNRHQSIRHDDDWLECMPELYQRTGFSDLHFSLEVC